MCQPKMPEVTQEELPVARPAEEAATNLTIKKKSKSERNDRDKLTIKNTNKSSVNVSDGRSGLTINP